MNESTEKDSNSESVIDNNDSKMAKLNLSLCGLAMIIHHGYDSLDRMSVQRVGFFDPFKGCEKPDLESSSSYDAWWHETPQFKFSYGVGDTKNRHWQSLGEISSVECGGISHNSRMWLGMGTSKGNTWVHELTPETEYSWPKNDSILSSKKSKTKIMSLCFREDVLFAGNENDELLVWHLPRKKLVHRHSGGKKGEKSGKSNGLRHIEFLTKPNLLAYQTLDKVCIYDLRKRCVAKELTYSTFFPDTSYVAPKKKSRTMSWYGIPRQSYWNDIKYDMESQLLHICLSAQHVVVLYDVRSGVVVKKLDDLRRNTRGCLSHLCLRKTQNELIVVENSCHNNSWMKDKMKKKELSSLPRDEKDWYEHHRCTSVENCHMNYFHMVDLNTFKVLRRFHDVSHTRYDQLYSTKTLKSELPYITAPGSNSRDSVESRRLQKMQEGYFERWLKEKQERKKTWKKKLNRGKKGSERKTKDVLSFSYEHWRNGKYDGWEKKMARKVFGSTFGPVLKIRDFPDQQNLFGSMYRDRVIVYSGETGKKKYVIGSGDTLRHKSEYSNEQSIKGLCYFGPKMLSPLLCVGYETANKELRERLDFVCGELANWEVSMLNKSVDVWKMLLMLPRGEEVEKERSVVDNIGLDVSEKSVFKLLFCTAENYCAKAREKKKGREGLERILDYFMFFGGVVAKNSCSHSAEKILHWSKEMLFESIKIGNWGKDVVIATVDQICQDESRKELLWILLELGIGSRKRENEEDVIQKAGRIFYENFVKWLQMIQVKAKKSKDYVGLKDDESSHQQKKGKQKDKKKTNNNQRKVGKMQEKSRFSFVQLLHRSRSETFNVLLRAKNEEDEWVEIPSHIEILCYKSNFFFCMFRFSGLEYEEFKEKGTITLEFMKSRLLLALLDFYYDPVGEIKTTDIATLLLIMEHAEIYQDSILMKVVVMKIRQRVRNSTKREVLEMLRNNRKMFENQKLLQLTMALFSREWIGISRQEFDAALIEEE